MKKFGKIAFTLSLVIAGAFIAVWAYSTFFDQPHVVTVKQDQPIRYANYPADSDVTLPDLTFAAEKSIHSVVHITTQTVQSAQYQFYGFRRIVPQIQQGSGSGVILSEDGYIVTNNHVIEGAENIKVVLNDKREFEANLVGTDPSTDIALLKIDASNLPYLTYGNSDDLKLGEWVLAVGNPFNLTSTVTAGIVSARARNLGINDDQMAIESFIQTDAAVNRGNSGGALVNQLGNLVGINTAIASQTGNYAGYSFAVPVSIVRKVVDDLKEFGEVQRALLGIKIVDVTAATAQELNLTRVEGVYVGEVTDGGAALDAGMKTGDIIIGIEGEPIKTTAQLQEKIGQYRPGDDVEVLVLRDNKEKQFSVTLRNRLGDTQIVKNSNAVLGAEFESVSDEVKEKLKIESGLQIKTLNNGTLEDAGLKEGFIITYVNKRPVFEVDDFKRVINSARGGIFVEGIYPNGEQAYFVFGVE
ncbi:MAG: Do family serine endopeptidase [Prolixibacteraceae bacterium]|nr:Do family serine endopeptidase [Prolixibacteraceae bacterium]